MSTDQAPDLWLLTAGRRGDLAQLRELARLSGWRTEEKSLSFRWNGLGRLPALVRHLLDAPSKAALLPPFPRFIAIAEAAAAGPARAIRQASQGFTRVIALGRPPGDPAAYDLILTTGQYALPDLPHIIRLPVPLTGRGGRADPEMLAQRLASAPRPWTLLLVGGAVEPDCLDSDIAAAMARDVAAAQARWGGSLLVVTSPRTARDVTDTLAHDLPQAVLFHRWQAHGDNPYAAALHLADQVLVTSDSISMATEALVARKPVMVYRLPQKRGRAGRLLTRLAAMRLTRPLFTSGLLESPADRLRYFEDQRAAGWLDWFPNCPAPLGSDVLGEAQVLAAASLRALSGEAQRNRTGENQKTG